MSEISEQETRRIAWIEAHERKRDAHHAAINAEYRAWAQSQTDREYRVQTDILSELRRIKAILSK